MFSQASLWSPCPGPHCSCWIQVCSFNFSDLFLAKLQFDKRFYIYHCSCSQGFKSLAILPPKKVTLKLVSLDFLMSSDGYTRLDENCRSCWWQGGGGGDKLMSSHSWTNIITCGSTRTDCQNICINLSLWHRAQTSALCELAICQNVNYLHCVREVLTDWGQQIAKIFV